VKGKAGHEMQARIFRHPLWTAYLNRTVLLLWMCMAAGLTLSIMTVLDICAETCAEAHTYRIFGMDLGWFGIAFFSFGSWLLAMRSRSIKVKRAFQLLLFASAGAEFNFLRVQISEIGGWCPICVAIAAAVFCAVLVLCCEQFNYLDSPGGSMKTYLKSAAVGITAMALGLSVAFIGMKTEAAENGFDPYLGKKNSSIVVYFFNDWFCPGCRRIEPRLESICGEVGKTARIGFIDYPIHDGTSNFTPYNLQFLVYEKEKYFSLRRALAGLALKTGRPSNGQVRAAIEPCGVRLRQINFSEVMAWMKMCDSIRLRLGVRETPTVVVINTNTGASRTLAGDEITLGAIKGAMARMND